MACAPGSSCVSGVCLPMASPACLVFEPGNYDFGTVQTGCRSAVTSFTIRNVCQQQVTVAVVGVAGGLGFSNPTVTLPTTLQPLGTLSFPITFSPTSVGRQTGGIVVQATHSAASFIYQTDLTGVGASSGLNQDRFTVPRKTDVVLIIDDSCSMFEEQMALGQNANALLAYAFSAGVDFNLGITTTDMDAFGMPLRGRFEGPPGQRILTATTPNLLQTFNQRVNFGTNGSGSEEMFAPALASVTQPLVTGDNAGFLRNDAALAVLALTDAADQSEGAPFGISNAGNSTEAFRQRLVGLKGHRRRNEFSFNFIGPQNTVVGCAAEISGSDPRQVEMTRNTGGVLSDICLYSQANWRNEVTRVGQAVFGARATWFLTARPTAGVTVLLNGTPVPETSGATRNWTYDAARNAVVFERFTPAPGQTVGFDYTVACMP